MSLSIYDAEKLIDDLKNYEIGFGRKPETWWTYENHVLGAAKIARFLAFRLNDVNPDDAYVCALLHDFCRIEEERKHRFHGLLGYEKLLELDEKVARASLLHMFIWNELPPYNKCSDMFYNNREDYDFVACYIKNTQITELDLLVQLVDNLANKDGFVTIEERWREYAQRHKITVPQEMLKRCKELKEYFDKKIGCDIYSFFEQGII